MNERSYSVMVVDDNEMNRDMLSRRLERTGYNVLVASNGKEALDLLAIESVDLVLLDIMMPEMDGFEFAELLRQNKDWLDIPVVVITSKDLTRDDHERLKGNVETIMQKGSYSKDDLLNEINEKISKFRTRSSHG